MGLKDRRAMSLRCAVSSARLAKVGGEDVDEPKFATCQDRLSRLAKF